MLTDFFIIIFELIKPFNKQTALKMLVHLFKKNKYLASVIFGTLWNSSRRRKLSPNSLGWFEIWLSKSIHQRCCMLSRYSCVWQFATLWTIACQAPLSMGFLRQEYWSGLPFPSPGDLADPGTEPEFLTSAALAYRSFTASATWKALHIEMLKDVNSNQYKGNCSFEYEAILEIIHPKFLYMSYN